MSTTLALKYVRVIDRIVEFASYDKLVYYVKPVILYLLPSTMAKWIELNLFRFLLLIVFVLVLVLRSGLLAWTKDSLMFIAIGPTILIRIVVMSEKVLMLHNLTEIFTFLPLVPPCKLLYSLLLSLLLLGGTIVTPSIRLFWIFLIKFEFCFNDLIAN